MIREAGFEVEGNPLSDGGGIAEGSFRLAGEGVLKPDMTRGV
jgi:hypothetical protein